jgi:hypothetical protein
MQGPMVGFIITVLNLHILLHKLLSLVTCFVNESVHMDSTHLHSDSYLFRFNPLTD